jgi:hypothetical protein
MPDTQKMQRKFFQNFLDTTMNGTTPSWYRLGKDLSEFNIELNPDTETSKNILGESTFTHNGFDVSANAEPFYARTGDDLFDKLQAIIDQGLQYDGCYTNILEVHLWDTGTTSGTYKAFSQPCYVVPTSYGGDTSGYQIPFTINYVGEKTPGYFAVATSTFTPDE